MAVTIKECEEFDVTVSPDRKDCFPAHTLILFCKDKLPSRKAVETAAKWLLLRAIERGWQFQP